MRELIREELNAIGQWWGRTRSDVDQFGPHAAVIGIKRLLWQGSFRLIGKCIYNYGERVFDHDWGVLIVLDACRADLMSEVADDYDFLPENIPTTASVGSHTTEWMGKNFTPNYSDIMQETGYIAGNPQSANLLNPDDWHYLSEPWRQHRDELGTTPPRAITDIAIDRIRTDSSSRTIVHYMQPHQPFRQLNNNNNNNNNKMHESERSSNDVWESLRFGIRELDEIWEAYRDNLQWVLGDVELLLHNIDEDKVVLTSDHGNAIGEWGFYGHPEYIPLKELKTVPWVEIVASDNESYTPSLADEQRLFSREDRLRDLGYLK